MTMAHSRRAMQERWNPQCDSAHVPNRRELRASRTDARLANALGMCVDSPVKTSRLNGRCPAGIEITQSSRSRSDAMTSQVDDAPVKWDRSSPNQASYSSRARARSGRRAASGSSPAGTARASREKCRAISSATKVSVGLCTPYAESATTASRRSNPTVSASRPRNASGSQGGSGAARIPRRGALTRACSDARRTTKAPGCAPARRRSTPRAEAMGRVAPPLHVPREYHRDCRVPAR